MTYARTILPCLAALLLHLPAAAQEQSVTVDEAFEMTVGEFNESGTEIKVGVINMNLTGINNYYIEHGRTADATCMREKYDEISAAGNSVLLTRIFDAINSGARDDQYVTDVIATVVEKSCSLAAVREAAEDVLDELEAEEQRLRQRLEELERNAWRLPDGTMVLRAERNGQQIWVYEDGREVPADLASQVAPPPRN